MTDFSTINTNQKILTTLVAKSGELVSDIRIGRKSDTGAACRNGGINMQNNMQSTTVKDLDECCRRCLEKQASEPDWLPITFIALRWTCHCHHGPYNETCQLDTTSPTWHSAACSYN